MTTTFLIHSDLSITISQGEVPTGSEAFASQNELIALATAWPMERLVATWNHLAGVRPVKKFTDRKTGAARIWNAIQSPSPDAAGEPDANEPTHVHVDATSRAAEPEAAAMHESAPETVEAQMPEPTLDSGPAPATVAVQAPDVAPKRRRAKETPTAESEPTTAPGSTKKEVVLAMLR